jgi:hypothetical protein
MLVRVINHWINNLMELHPDRDTYTLQPWYIKWNESYPYMQSSRCTLYEIYCTLSRNYTIQSTGQLVHQKKLLSEELMPQMHLLKLMH